MVPARNGQGVHLGVLAEVGKTAKDTGVCARQNQQPVNEEMCVSPERWQEGLMRLLAIVSERWRGDHLC